MSDPAPQGESQVWSNTDGDSVTIVTDPSVDVDSATLRQAFAQHPEIGAITNWLQYISTADNGRPGQNRSGGIFERDRYTTPHGIFREFQVARDASEHDDVVSNILESTEALVFNTVRIECGDEDEENIWDQILQDIQLDLRLREMWRDLFTYSQYYIAALYGNKSYKVEGIGEQRARRKKYDLQVPTALSMIDPLKVLPYGDFLFGKDRLLYIANRTEAASIDDVIAGKNTSDQVVTSLLTQKVELDRKERTHLSEVTGSAELSNLYQFAPGLVWRHTASRPSYARFAPVRMASVFELLDLKHQLRQMDRASLLGATNFIVLVKKGSEKEPATTAELEHLSSTVRQVSRTPLIVGDHRLSIEIITPNLDPTLDPKRYNTLDSRIAARLYQIMHIGGFSAGASGDDSLKLTRVIARGLESRRQMIKENIERNLLLPVWKANPSLKSKPSLAFTPRSVALDFDPNFLNVMMDLYHDGAISRETMGGVVDVDQETEAHNRTVEKERYDKIMVPRQMTPGQQGRKFGGENNGGGENPDSRVGNPTPRRPDADVPDQNS